jgi:hypothetical protein
VEKLVERERELAAIDALLERGGAVLVVEGRAGVRAPSTSFSEGGERVALLERWPAKYWRVNLAARPVLAPPQGGLEGLFAVAGGGGVEVDAGLDDLPRGERRGTDVADLALVDEVGQRAEADL